MLENKRRNERGEEFAGTVFGKAEKNYVCVINIPRTGKKEGA